MRRFNEDNNEEAGEYWTPRDAVKLIANLIFLPIARLIESGTCLLFDGMVGNGGRLTVGEKTFQTLAKARGKQVATHLYAQESTARPTRSAKRTSCSKAMATPRTTSSAGRPPPRLPMMPSAPAPSIS